MKQLSDSFILVRIMLTFASVVREDESSVSIRRGLDGIIGFILFFCCYIVGRLEKEDKNRTKRTLTNHSHNRMNSGRWKHTTSAAAVPGVSSSTCDAETKRSQHKKRDWRRASAIVVPLPPRHLHPLPLHLKLECRSLPHPLQHKQWILKTIEHAIRAEKVITWGWKGQIRAPQFEFGITTNLSWQVAATINWKQEQKPMQKNSAKTALLKTATIANKQNARQRSIQMPGDHHWQNKSSTKPTIATHFGFRGEQLPPERVTTTRTLHKTSSWTFLKHQSSCRRDLLMTVVVEHASSFCCKCWTSSTIGDKMAILDDHRDVAVSIAIVNGTRHVRVATRSKTRRPACIRRQHQREFYWPKVSVRIKCKGGEER